MLETLFQALIQNFRKLVRRNLQFLSEPREIQIFVGVQVLQFHQQTQADEGDGQLVDRRRRPRPIAQHDQKIPQS
ncbi:MAG: hypothetical protein NXI24_23235 [bacterium]|nr:hypothetical protein [bacterium]